MWPELATTDRAAGVAFYSTLFGWSVNDQPMGPDEIYTIFQSGGKDVCAGYDMRAEERQAAPPHWNAYIAVDSADAATERARSLGAQVLAGPFDVMDLGRMSVLQDPTGAAFCLWESKKNIGAQVLGEPGALCWTELTTSDTATAEHFYTSLFAWTPKHSAPGSPMPYTEFTAAGADGPTIGMMAKPPHLPPHVPSFWLPYFLVTDVEATIARASSLGGETHFGPMDIPDGGRFAVLADPQGAAFAVFRPKQK
jgi:predicted enzyme related to lactoylglutathione lyase